MPLGYAEEATSRASRADSNPFPAAYDEKDDMDSLKAQLQRRKKPILAGLALLGVVVIGLSVGLTQGGDSETANTQSAEVSCVRAATIATVIMSIVNLTSVVIVCRARHQRTARPLRS